MTKIQTDRCTKGMYYIVVTEHGIYYTVMQQGQRTWIANALPTVLGDKPQMLEGNGYKVIDLLRESGGNIDIYSCHSIVDMRKGIMASLVAIRPDHSVYATSSDEKVIIEVTK